MTLVALVAINLFLAGVTAGIGIGGLIFSPKYGHFAAVPFTA